MMKLRGDARQFISFAVGNGKNIFKFGLIIAFGGTAF
jgi:hypothetical protein